MDNMPCDSIVCQRGRGPLPQLHWCCRLSWPWKAFALPSNLYH